MPCPEPVTGGAGFCVAGDKGSVLCVIQAQCSACRIDAACTDRFGPAGRCLNSCALCQEFGKSACILPA